MEKPVIEKIVSQSPATVNREWLDRSLNIASVALFLGSGLLAINSIEPLSLASSIVYRLSPELHNVSTMAPEATRHVLSLLGKSYTALTGSQILFLVGTVTSQPKWRTYIRNSENEK